mmetsp:Transcript_11301/g.31476  ORF Transcript_11301/g.31476 Transcript_11301/m.31476 type:complete len:209 (+) Transcript_11301:70-696(+)
MEDPSSWLGVILPLILKSKKSSRRVPKRTTTTSFTREGKEEECDGDGSVWCEGSATGNGARGEGWTATAAAAACQPSGEERPGVSGEEKGRGQERRVQQDGHRQGGERGGGPGALRVVRRGHESKRGGDPVLRVHQGHARREAVPLLGEVQERELLQREHVEREDARVPQGPQPPGGEARGGVPLRVRERADRIGVRGSGTQRRGWPG